MEESAKLGVECFEIMIRFDEQLGSLKEQYAKLGMLRHIYLDDDYREKLFEPWHRQLNDLQDQFIRYSKKLEEQYNEYKPLI